MRKVLALLLLSSSVQALPVLDQSHLGGTSYPLSAYLSESVPYTAQTFTVGIEGVLVGAKVRVGSGPAVLALSLYDTQSGVPNAPLASQILLAEQDYALSELILFDLPVPVLPGEQYALVLDAIVSTAAWSGSSALDPFSAPGAYAGGRLFGSQDGVNWAPDLPSFDTYFQTFVEPIPEPSTVVLVGLGLLMLASRNSSAAEQALRKR